MVKIIVDTMKKPVTVKKPVMGPVYIPPEERPQPPPPSQYEPRPPPGVVVTETPGGGFSTRVTLPPGASSRLQWEQGETVETTTGTMTPYVLKGTITHARKTTGITPVEKEPTPLQKTGMGISQKAADMFGLSGQQTQEMFTHVDVPGDPEYRSKLLAEKKAEVGPSAREIGTFLLQTPGYVGMGAGLSGVAGTLRAAAYAPQATKGAVAAHGLFTYGLITSGATMGAVTAADIATTESKTMQEWKLFQTGSALALMAYGAKPHGSVGRALTRMEYQQYQRMTSDLNLQLGGSPEYGMYRVGKPGVLEAKTFRSQYQDIYGPPGKIGRVYTHQAEALFKPGDMNIFMDYPRLIKGPGGHYTTVSTTGPQFQMTGVGYSEAMHAIIPGVDKPVSTSLLTATKYRTGEIHGLITSGKMLKFTKLEPGYTPYADIGKPWGFEGTPLRFTKTTVATPSTTPVTVKTPSSSVIGAPSGLGGVTQFVKPFTRAEQQLLFSEIMQTPWFNVHPPGARAPVFTPVIRPVDVTKTHVETQKGLGTQEMQDMFKTYGTAFKTDDSLGFKPDVRQDPWRDTRVTPRTRDIVIPDTRVIPWQEQKIEQKIEQTMEFPFDYPFDHSFRFTTPFYTPHITETTTTIPPGVPRVPPLNLGEAGERGFGDWLVGIRRERRHRVGDPFEALKEFRL